MPDCFIMMPITTPDFLLPDYGGDIEHFKHVQEHLFMPAIVRAGFNPISPIAEGADIIHAEIIRNLEMAEMVLCDISTTNPNVFFELGIRTALNKSVCIVKDDKTLKVPFDAEIINFHTYLGSLDPWELEKQIDKLVDHIEKSFKRSDGQNMLWTYFGPATRVSHYGILKHIDPLNEKNKGRVRRGEDGHKPGPSQGKQLPKNERVLIRLKNIASKYDIVITESKLESDDQISLFIKPGSLTRYSRQKLLQEARESNVDLLIFHDDGRKNKQS